MPVNENPRYTPGNGWRTTPPALFFQHDGTEPESDHTLRASVSGFTVAGTYDRDHDHPRLTSGRDEELAPEIQAAWNTPDYSGEQPTDTDLSDYSA